MNKGNLMLITQLLVKDKNIKFQKLSDLIDIQKGTQLNKKLLLDDSSYYPVINGGKLPSGYWKEYNFNKDLITISQGGASAGYVQWQEKEFWAGAHCYVVINLNKCNYRYIYYFLKDSEEQLIKSQYGAGIPALNKSDILNLSIPIPPLDIQNKIVEILDSFTNYKAELTAELTARLKQYKYYRDKLLDFKDKDVEYKKIEECFIFFNGMTNVSKKWQDTGNCEFIDYLNVYKNLSTNVNETYKATVKSLKQSILKQWDILFTSASETIEECAICSVIEKPIKDNIFLDDHLFGIRVKEEYLKNINPSFYKFYFNSNEFKIKCRKSIRGVTRFYVSKEVFKKISIPIPPLDIQNKIVEILDSFSSLVNEISDGLPLEIELRNKQYEYYRDLLLNFKGK